MFETIMDMTKFNQSPLTYLVDVVDLGNFVKSAIDCFKKNEDLVRFSGRRPTCEARYITKDD